MSTHTRTHSPQLLVRQLRASAQEAFLECGPLRARCALGRSGTRVLKREGDGATPWGRFRLSAVLFNPQAVRRPITVLPVRAIAQSDGWCDAAQDGNYNRLVRLPYRASAEHLWRDDGLYDVVVVIDCNRKPRVQHRGSAIFIHIARPGFLPTEGCVALARADLLKLLRVVRRTSRLTTTR
jgi:L,D-peptidoglycan transpeptidase YkuD (ErfK/YbiS/YcfS/YnhG family)